MTQAREKWAREWVHKKRGRLLLCEGGKHAIACKAQVEAYLAGLDRAGKEIVECEDGDRMCEALRHCDGLVIQDRATGRYEVDDE